MVALIARMTTARLRLQGALAPSISPSNGTHSGYSVSSLSVQVSEHGGGGPI